MAARGWTAQVAAAAGVAAGTGAAQLGLGYGLGVVVWPTGAADGDDVWLGSLGWATWIAASATVFGAVIAGRLGRAVGGPWRFALAASAAVGALLTVALIALPARNAVRPDTFSPETVAGGYAVIGVLLGLMIAYWAVLSRPVAANLIATAGWLWALATAAIVADVFWHRPTATYLSSWQFASAHGDGQGTIHWPSALLTLLAAFVLGVIGAWPAARRGDLGVAAATSGAVGPLLVAAAFFVLAPQLSPPFGPLGSAYLIAPYAVLAGLAGSAATIALAQQSAARRTARTDTPRGAAVPTPRSGTDAKQAGRAGAEAKQTARRGAAAGQATRPGGEAQQAPAAGARGKAATRPAAGAKGKPATGLAVGAEANPATRSATGTDVMPAPRSAPGVEAKPADPTPRPADKESKPSLFGRLRRGRTDKGEVDPSSVATGRAQAPAPARSSPPPAQQASGSATSTPASTGALAAKGQATPPATRPGPAKSAPKPATPGSVPAKSSPGVPQAQAPGTPPAKSSSGAVPAKGTGAIPAKTSGAVPAKASGAVPARAETNPTGAVSARAATQPAGAGSGSSSGSGSGTTDAGAGAQAPQRETVARPPASPTVAKINPSASGGTPAKRAPARKSPPAKKAPPPQAPDRQDRS
ncbi:Hansenula MRAKII killer toxin-resistant protein 1 [Actinoplanes sp. NPDC051475]|uniref:Hansenula MRAKII killer toxin-resistant protein 1 n=1 Tax=Actinoplanes sp. NPDC051475 TaxID=3157225 RepID=UPI00344FB42B